MDLEARLRAEARAAARTAARADAVTLLRRVAPTLPYDDLLAFLRRNAPIWGLRVLTPGFDENRHAAGPAPWAEVAAALAVASDPEAVLAAELIQRADAAGFIPDRDADLARDLRLPEADCRAARAYLQQRFGIGYRNVFDYWLEAGRRDPDGLDPETERLLCILRERPDPDPAALARRTGQTVAEIRSRLDPLRRRYGWTPLEEAVRPVPAGPPTPDIAAVSEGDGFTYTVLCPTIQPAAEPDAAATVTLSPETADHIRRLLLRLSVVRSRVLGRLFETAMRYNGDWVRGRRWFRQPVPLRELYFPESRLRRLHGLRASIDGRIYPMWELLGYSLANSHRIVHFPLEVIREVRNRNPDLSISRIRELLRAYGISISRRWLIHILQQR